jgi:branched-chain amino acid transport system permease protein
MIFVGGLDTIAGAVIGAGVVVVLPIWVANGVKTVGGSGSAIIDGPNIALIVYGMLIVFFVTSSPGGIVGLVSGLTRRLERWVAARRRLGDEPVRR